MAPDQLTPLAYALLLIALALAVLAVAWPDQTSSPDDDPQNLDTRGPDDR